MAKKDWDDFERKLKQAIEQLASPQILQQIGEKAKDLIVERSTAGYGVQNKEKEGQPKKKFTKLSPAYITRRASKPQQLSPRTTPSKSNVTFTGQMLDSMKAVVSTGKVSITTTGKRRGSKLSNQEVQNFVEEQGRSFNQLTDQDLKRLQNFVADILKLLTRYL